MSYNKDNFLEGSLTDFIDFEQISKQLPKTEDEQPLPYYERDDYKAAGKLEGRSQSSQAAILESVVLSRLLMSVKGQRLSLLSMAIKREQKKRKRVLKN